MLPAFELTLCKFLKILPCTTNYCEVSRQKPGRGFKVVTPAGEISVVGTKFSVESRLERQPGADALEKRAGPDKNLKFHHPLDVGVRGDTALGNYSSTATVKVDEGAVIVRNRYGIENRLSPGQTAVLRSKSNVIDVFQGDSSK